MRVARSVCGVCLMGDRIYVVGGWCDKDEDWETVEVYNPDRDEWIEVSRAPFTLTIMTLSAALCTCLWLQLCFFQKKTTTTKNALRKLAANLLFRKSFR